MGMFDSIWFHCPRCDSQIEGQSKAGNRDLIDYSADNVPAGIADDIDGELLHCGSCKQTWQIVARQVKRVRCDLITPETNT